MSDHYQRLVASVESAINYRAYLISAWNTRKQRPGSTNSNHTVVDQGLVSNQSKRQLLTLLLDRA